MSTGDDGAQRERDYLGELRDRLAELEVDDYGLFLTQIYHLGMLQEVRRIANAMTVLEPLGRVLNGLAEQVMRSADALDVVRRLAEEAVGDRLVLTSSVVSQLKRKKRKK